ncbi:MAG TPA: hypothetical protein VE441_02480 [Mycobacterium sp.]|nr:hypothetical protein [Mycobacterium sp.]
MTTRTELRDYLESLRAVRSTGAAMTTLTELRDYLESLRADAAEQRRALANKPKRRKDAEVAGWLEGRVDTVRDILRWLDEEEGAPRG